MAHELGFEQTLQLFREGTKHYLRNAAEPEIRKWLEETGQETMPDWLAAGLEKHICNGAYMIVEEMFDHHSAGKANVVLHLDFDCKDKKPKGD